MVEATGFEPAASWSQTKCATKLRHAPNNLFIIHYFFRYVNHFEKNFEKNLILNLYLILDKD